MNGDDVEPVEQILTETSVLHLVLEIDIGGGNDAHIHLDGFHPTEAHELALLHHAQQLGLRLERDVADLVEEDAAFVREIEQTLLGVDGTGEGALDVTKEGGLEQVGRKVARVDGDERLVRAGGVAVDRARDQFLTGAAFPGDEDRRPARRRLDDEVENLFHPRTLADDVGKLVVARLQVLFERDVLGDQPPPLNGVA